MKTIADIRNMTGTEIANMLAYMAGQNDKIESLQGERTLAWNEFETEYRKQDKRIEHLESAIAESCDDMRSEFLRLCPIADKLQAELKAAEAKIDDVRKMADDVNTPYVNGYVMRFARLILKALENSDE